jgi:methionyl aminopeptidase
MRATEEALSAGIQAACPGATTGDIGAAIQEVIEREGFSVVKALGGHGVGDRVHEEPFIANFGRPGTGEVLEEGMVLALEPIASAGKAAVVLAPDGYTYRTKDGSRSAHFEHTILLEAGGARIMTA